MSKTTAAKKNSLSMIEQLQSLTQDNSLAQDLIPPKPTTVLERTAKTPKTADKPVAKTAPATETPAEETSLNNRPAARRHQTSIYISAETHAFMKQLSTITGREISSLTEQIIAEWRSANQEQLHAIVEQFKQRLTL